MQHLHAAESDSEVGAEHHDAERHHRYQQRVSAVGNADAVRNSNKPRQRFLELGDLRTHDVRAVRQHRVDSPTQPLAEALLLTL